MYSKEKTLGKRLLVALITVISLMVMLCASTPTISVYAEGVEDNVGSQQQTVTQQQPSEGTGGIQTEPLSPEDQAIGDTLKGHRTMTPDQLQKASEEVSPITNIIGWLMGIIIAVGMALIGLITALDLLYIAVPPVRNLLYKSGTDGTGAYTGGAMNVGGASGGSTKPTQWVSDEAVSCAALLGGSATSSNAMNVGMSMGGGAQQTQSKRSVIGTYLKKRVIFLALFAVCLIILTSSIAMDTGINLAQWALKIVSAFNTKMS